MSDEHEGCEHSFDDHLLLADNTGDPLDGGTIICPVDDCDCRSTWSVGAQTAR